MLRRLLRQRPPTAPSRPQPQPHPATPPPAGQNESGFDDAGRFGRGHCADCGTDVPIWRCDASVWQEVMGRSPQVGLPGHGICPTCFVARAAAVGVTPATWHLAAHWRPDAGGGRPEATYRPRHAAA